MTPKKMIDLGTGKAEYGSGFKLAQTNRGILVETSYCEKAQTPFRAGKTYRILAEEVRPRGVVKRARKTV